MDRGIYGPYADKLDAVLDIVIGAVKACGDSAAGPHGERRYEHIEGRVKTGESMRLKLGRRRTP